MRASLNAIVLTGLSVAAAQAPAVPDVTSLKLDLIALKQQLALVTAQAQVCQGQVAPGAYRESMTALEREIASVVADFEHTHPGWTLHPQTRQPQPKGGQ